MARKYVFLLGSVLSLMVPILTMMELRNRGLPVEIPVTHVWSYVNSTSYSRVSKAGGDWYVRLELDMLLQNSRMKKWLAHTYLWIH